jgi:hypothetical protein
VKKKENVAVTGDDLWFDRFVRLREFALKDLVEKEGIDPDDLEAIFSHQSSLIKDIYKASRRFLENTERNYPKQLRYSKADPFPRPWMRRDKAISRIIETHPTFVKLANYLFERNRRWRGDRLKKMMEEADALTGGRRYLDRHAFSTFMTSAAFYCETIEKLNLSKSSVEKYLGAFAKIGIIRALHDSGRYGMLYSDGYFVKSDDGRYRKISFLKDDPVIKAGLKRLPEFIRKYVKVRVHL